MCQDVQSSLAAGGISWLTAAILWSSGSLKWQWLAAFIASFSTVQFVDAGVWAAGPSSATALVLVRYVLPLVLASEPLVNYWGFRRALKRRLPWFEIFLGVFCVYLVANWMLTCGQPTTVTRDGWLKWCDADSTAIGKLAFLVALAVPFLYFPDPVMRAIILGGGTLAWALNFHREAWGSRWCHFSNALSVISLGVFILGQ